MKSIRYNIILMTVLTFCVLKGYTQRKPWAADPVIGQPCPDYELHNIEYFSKKQCKISDFRGKWLILDFWNKQCHGCIASFPHTKKLQKEFGDKVQFMLVGFEDKENEIRSMYARFREQLQLGMPCSFDSTLCQRFDFYAMPQILVIDTAGIIRGWVNTINAEQIKEFLSGNLSVLSKPKRMYFDNNKPFLIGGNGGNDTDFMFRSVLAKWNSTQTVWSSGGISDNNIENGRFQVLGVPLVSLYNTAFFGVDKPGGGRESPEYSLYDNKPVLELTDSSFFKFSYSKQQNIFCYSLTLPKGASTKERLMQIMQQDLRNYFGFEARVEERDCPYLALVATDVGKVKLKTKGGPETSGGYWPLIHFARNIPVSYMLSWLEDTLGDNKYFDETGIMTNIDYYFNGLSSNKQDVNNFFIENGLSLVRKTRRMKVVVIRDAAAVLSSHK